MDTTLKQDKSHKIKCYTWILVKKVPETRKRGKKTSISKIKNADFTEKKITAILPLSSQTSTEFSKFSPGYHLAALETHRSSSCATLPSLSTWAVSQNSALLQASHPWSFHKVNLKPSKVPTTSFTPVPMVKPLLFYLHFLILFSLTRRFLEEQQIPAWCDPLGKRGGPGFQHNLMVLWNPLFWDPMVII